MLPESQLINKIKGIKLYFTSFSRHIIFSRHLSLKNVFIYMSWWMDQIIVCICGIVMCFDFLKINSNKYSQVPTVVILVFSNCYDKTTKITSCRLSSIKALVSFFCLFLCLCMSLSDCQVTYCTCD